MARKRLGNMKRKKQMKNNKRDDHPIIHDQISKNDRSKDFVLIAIIAFAFFFVNSPYYQALFFENTFYKASVFIQVLFLLTIIISFKEMKAFILDYWKLMVFIIVIPTLYAFTYWYGITPLNAANEALRWFTYLLVFMLLIIWFSIFSWLKEWFWGLCWLTIFWIVGFVYLVDWGYIDYPLALFGDRFASVLEYANTFASLVGAFIVGGLVGLTKRVNTLWLMIYGSPMIMLMIAFLMAESRGGMIAFACGWFLVLFFLTWKEQILYASYTVLMMILSVWGYVSYGSMRYEENPTMIILMLLFLTFLFVMIIFVIQNWFIKNVELHAQQIPANLFLPIGIIFFSLVMFVSQSRDKIVSVLPEQLQIRLSTINLNQHSVQERLALYKDAFQMWQDRFFFGGGGGTWEALFESYKSLPYYTTDPHNYYVNILLEVGLIGALFVFGFLTYVIMRGIWTFYSLDNEGKEQFKNMLPVIVIAIMLLVHVVIDFNMSIGTYSLFVFSLLALIWSYTHLANHKVHKESRLFIFYKQFTLKMKPEFEKPFVIFVCSFLVVGMLIATIMSLSYLHADKKYLRAVYANDDSHPLITIDRLDEALSFNKNNIDIRLAKIDVLKSGYEELDDHSFLEQINQEYTDLYAVDSTNYRYYYRYARFLLDIGETEQAYDYLKPALEHGPWEQTVYETMINEMLNHALETRQASLDQVESSDASVNIKNQLEQMRVIIKQLEEKLRIQNEDVPEGFVLEWTAQIELTRELRVLLARAYYLMGDHHTSLDYLDVELSISNDEREFMLYQLLNYKHLNQENKMDELLQTSIAQDALVYQLFQEKVDDPNYIPFDQ